MEATEALASRVGVLPACAALGVSRATFYRSRAAVTEPRERRPSPPLKLSPDEVDEIVEVLNSPRFMDQSPRQVWATLLDEDERYLCSIRTMYRILESRGEVRERRNQARRPKYKKPELLATGPNEVWTWDITKLKGATKGSWLYLYVVLDIFSRYVVGWTVAPREQADLAEDLIRASHEKQKITPAQLTIHADRGPSMTSKTVALLMSELGVAKSHSRPYTSNDNPFSEAQFKTLKYHSSFPERFGSLQDARAYLGEFFTWYNTQHRHGGLSLLTPADVHYNRAPALLERRKAVLLEAFKTRRNRFKNQEPRAGALPEEVWINPPKPQEDDGPAVPVALGPEEGGSLD